MADITASLIEDLNLKISDSLGVSGAAGTASSSYGALSLSAAGLWTYTPKATVQALRLGETVIDTLTIASKSYAITLRGDNDFATLGGAIKASIAEDKALAVSGVLSVKDADAGEAGFLSYVVAQALYGTFSFTASSGLWTYTPNPTLIPALKAKETAIEKLTVFTADGSSTVVNVTLTGANDAASITGTTLGVDGKTNILARVTESDASLLSASGHLGIADADAASSSFQKLEKAGKLGWFSLATDGTWSYRADAMNSSIQKLFTSQSLSDTFVVKSADGLSSQAVTVFIDGVSDNSLGGRAAITAKAATPTLASGTVKSLITQLDSGLKLSAGDIDALPKTPQAGAYGTFLVAADGSWTYTLDYTKAAVIALPLGLTLTDTILLGAARLNVAITGINEAPSSINAPVTATLTEDAGLVDGWLISSGSLSISDPDAGQSGFQKLVTSTATSLFSLAENGDWSFRIANSDAALQKLSAGKFLVKKFTAKSLDGKASSSVSITLNGSNTLTLSGDQAELVEDQNQRTQGKLFSLDAGKALTATPNLISGQYGLFSIAKDGRWSYVQQKDLGEGSFVDTVQVSLGTATAALKVTIHGSNDAAILSGNRSASMDEDSSGAVGQLTITDDDFGQQSFIAAEQNGTYGRFVMNTAGAWSYIPDDRADTILAGSSATETFTVMAFDSTSTSVQIEISGSNDVALISGPRAATMDEDSAGAQGELNIIDPDQGQAAFIAASLTGLYGAFSINENGLWMYVPDDRADTLPVAASVLETFTLRSIDSTTHNIAITVNGSNDAPLITSISSASGNEDTSISASVVVSDVDNTSFSYSVSTPTKGSVSINAAGLWTYAPSANSNGADSFTVTVSDGSGASVTQTISLTVNPVNDAPIITSLASASGDEDTSISASVVVSDVDNTSFSYSVDTPTKGGVSINSSGLWTYAPSANSNGADSFTVTVFDGSGGSVTQTISLTVNPVNDAAIFGGSRHGAVTEDSGSTTANGTVTVSDIDSPAEAVFALSTSAGLTNRGVFIFTAATGAWSYSVDNANLQSLGAGVTHDDTLGIASADGSTTTLSVTLTGVDDPAVVSGDFTGSVTEDSATILSTSGQLNVTDVDGVAESVFSTLVSSANGNLGSLSISTSGAWSYSLANSLIEAMPENQSRTDSFTITTAGGTSATVTLTIYGNGDPLGPLSLATGHPQITLGNISKATLADKTGSTVAILGDVNGDGFDDFLVNAGDAVSARGITYLVFGSSAGIAALDLASFSASNGIKITGAVNGDHSGEVLADIGDYTSEADGSILHDFALGNPDADSGSGNVAVFFGKIQPLDPYTPGSSDPSLYWSNQLLAGFSGGFKIFGAGTNAALGSSIAGIGDINGDSFEDLLIGAPGSGNGQAWIVYGLSAGMLPGNLNLATATADKAIAITGAAVSSAFGSAAAGLGDVNGDGLSDFLVGASSASSGQGEAWLFLGTGSLSSAINLSSPPVNAIRLTGGNAAAAGSEVSSAGDVNGDGFSDFLVGSPGTSSVQLVFGHSGAWSGLDLASLGTAGITLSGTGIGSVLSAAGDVNGDGFSDFLIGAPSQEKSFLIFGKASGWSNLDLGTLGYPDGCVISSTSGDLGGSALSGGGDVNGDGFDDLLLGRPGSDSAVLISGGDFSDGITGLIRGSGSFSGTSGADLLIGSSSADTISALGGADVLRSGSGDDTLILTSNEFRAIDGGGGTDTVKLSGSNINLDLTSHAAEAWQGIEVIDLNGGSNKITLSIDDILGHTLKIKGDATNKVDIDLASFTLLGLFGDYKFYEHDTLFNCFLQVQVGVDVI